MVADVPGSIPGPRLLQRVLTPLQRVHVKARGPQWPLVKGDLIMEFPIYYQILDILGITHWLIGFIFLGGLILLAFLLGANYGHRVATDAQHEANAHQDELESLQRMLDESKGVTHG